MLVSVWTNSQGQVYPNPGSGLNSPIGRHAEWLVHPQVPTTFKGWLKFKLFYVALRVVKWALK